MEHFHQRTCLPSQLIAIFYKRASLIASLSINLSTSLLFLQPVILILYRYAVHHRALVWEQLPCCIFGASTRFYLVDS